MKVASCRIWLPSRDGNWRAFFAQPPIEDALDRFPEDGWIAPGQSGGARVDVGPLPLTYGVLEVQLVDQDGSKSTLWARQRIKREVLDIGGGWLADRLGEGNTLHAKPYLETLSRMHITAGKRQHVSGCSGAKLYEQFPLKYTNRLQPIEQYDNDTTRSRIHAVEFLGEPQYGGGTPVPPEDVRKALVENRRLIIKDQIHVVGVYSVSPRIGLRSHLETEFATLIQQENRHDFDPAKKIEDLEVLNGLLQED